MIGFSILEGVTIATKHAGATRIHHIFLMPQKTHRKAGCRSDESKAKQLQLSLQQRMCQANTAFLDVD